MQSKSKIEVQCIYYSREGRQVTFQDIIQGIEELDEVDNTLANFWQVTGGISVTLDGYCTIFCGLSFYNLFLPVNFLLHSLYLLNELPKSSWFDEDDEYPSCVVVRTMVGEKLILERTNETTINLSFLPKDGIYEYQRGKYYFKKVSIDRAEWISSTKVALNEYFSILERLLTHNNDPQVPNISAIREYLDVWTIAARS